MYPYISSEFVAYTLKWKILNVETKDAEPINSQQKSNKYYQDFISAIYRRGFLQLYLKMSLIHLYWIISARQNKMFFVWLCPTAVLHLLDLPLYYFVGLKLSDLSQSSLVLFQFCKGASYKWYFRTDM